MQLRKYMRPAADGSDSVRWSKVALAKDVLNELPDQVSAFDLVRHIYFSNSSHSNDIGTFFSVTLLIFSYFHDMFSIFSAFK